MRQKIDQKNRHIITKTVRVNRQAGRKIPWTININEIRIDSYFVPGSVTALCLYFHNSGVHL